MVRVSGCSAPLDPEPVCKDVVECGHGVLDPPGLTQPPGMHRLGLMPTLTCPGLCGVVYLTSGQDSGKTSSI